MNVRLPYRAGSFYPASPGRCREDVHCLTDSVDLPTDLPQGLRGGLVPHAGWTYSGKLAAGTLKALCAGGAPKTFVVLGADHTGAARQGEVFDSGAWQTPVGDLSIDEELASALLDAASSLRANPQAHTQEHSIEVQTPLIQILAPEAKFVPITVPPTAPAVQIGEAIGEVLSRGPGPTVVVGSTDLTHHGGHFGSPHGTGRAGEQWSRQNDRRMLDLIEAMEAERIIVEARERMNACGAGAVAATVAACKCLGATRGLCLEYTNSYELIHATMPDYADDTTVGYASVVFARGG